MGNTASQQISNQNSLKRFSSPRHPRHQSVSRGSQGSHPTTSSPGVDPTSVSRERDSSEAKHSRDSRRDTTKERDGKHYVHRSLRVKKKSLELPDLAPLSLNPYQPTNQTSSRTSSTSFSKSPSIPIPGQQESHRHRSVNAVDFYQPPPPQLVQPTYRDAARKTGHQQSVQPTAPHVPHPSLPPFLQPSITHTSGLLTPYASTSSFRESSSSPGGDSSSIATPAQSSFDDHAGDITITADISEAVVESSQFNPLTVNSSIPLGITKVEEDTVLPLPLPPVSVIADLVGSTQSQTDGGKRRESSDGGDTEDIMVKISWHGGGNEVFLARQGDEKYMNKMKMEREGSSNTFSTALYLAHGTHHIRFFVDEQWRVADDLPATVDDLGGLANYVAVGPGFADKTLPGSPLPTSPPMSTATSVILLNTPKSGTAHKVEPHTPPRNLISTGYSFWDQPDDDDEDPQVEPVTTSPPGQLRTKMAGSTPTGLMRLTTTNTYVPKWTNEIPLELIEAAAQEEAFLAHQQVQQAHYYNKGRGYPRTQNGFMPLPNIPPAPRLPRILEKLILNQQQIVRNTVTSASAAGPLAGASLASPGGITNRIGGIPTQNRERESRDRVRSPIRDRERDRERIGGVDRRRERDKRSLGMTTTTPIEEKEFDLSSSRDREERLLPVTTASGTDITGTPEKPSLPPSRDSPREGRPMSPPSRGERPDQFGTGRHPAVVDNRTIADDSSVLPVPSHVVIHHLCTSAIKNGVLGVGATTRYKKKYMSSVYYKPT
ncbi:hypothetical protein E1B28_002570 [Marasmius oreades]|uniref:Association with the SNF1 complex (ASC) domain-containing protein n=1 Tax=Marasmius oreades TaxID=181124 RepID=A0A9P7ULM8_9AGAR|nr:uncharacterized protein E1B28_002570 [Marasmius oreades]KAG7086628.1 hypothetical protein E1B28_002570 [Marasmius oreades]